MDTMDWIKQIIECKKGNLESPVSLGKNNKELRMIRRYKQQKLMWMSGISLYSVNVRSTHNAKIK